jgi:hypothetical protein
MSSLPGPLDGSAAELGGRRAAELAPGAGMKIRQRIRLPAGAGFR